MRDDLQSVDEIPANKQTRLEEGHLAVHAAQHRVILHEARPRVEPRTYELLVSEHAASPHAPSAGDDLHTLEIITRILSEVVNRDRLCSTNACCASFAIFGAVRLLEEVQTQSSFVWLLDSKMVQ